MPGRILGVDLARFAAVFWMFVIHVGPDGDTGWPDRIVWLGHGRAAALFAFLAGVTLTLVHGGRRPPPWRSRGDTARFAATARSTAVRSAVLLLLGLWLAGLETGARVILPFYAVYFVLALPGLYLSTRILAALATVWALTGPVVSMAVRYAGGRVDPGMRVPDFAALADPGEVAVTLFVTGTYPVLTWMPFVLAGMAVGRLDLLDRGVHRALILVGTVLALLGYGLSRLVLDAFGGRAAVQAAADNLFGLPPGKASVPDTLAWFSGTVPPNDPVWLTVAQGHSGTPFEVVGAIGVACGVLGVCLAATRNPARAKRLAAPIAAGAMSLSVYVVHLLAGWSPLTPGSGSWVRVLAYTAVSLGGAWLWARRLGKGPLERVLAAVAGRPAPRPAPEPEKPSAPTPPKT
jgi:hypothetical protein